MTKKFSLSVTMLALVMVTIIGCKKEDALTLPGEQAHFTNKSSGSYQVTAPGVTYKIPVGLTTVSNSPRTINVTVTSPTGAVQGTHYTLNKTSFVIPAGQVLDTLVVTGSFTAYSAGRKDTLIFEIAGVDKGGVAPSTYNSKFTLAMRGPCFEGEIATSLSSLLGDYNNTRDTLAGAFTYGPYKTTVKSATLTSATTANIVVANLYDEGWSDLTFTLDWSDINNRKVTLVTQNAGGNAGNTFGAGYNGQPYGIRPVPASAGGLVGTFTYCTQFISIKAQIGIFGVGYASNIYTVAMRRS